VHHDHDDLYHYFDRHNKYSDWEAVVSSTARARVSDESQSRTRKAMKRIIAQAPLQGPTAFTYSYVLKLGLLDGRAGFHYAVAKAVYRWQIGLKSRQARDQ
jgi:hypothetical protein